MIKNDKVDFFDTKYEKLVDDYRKLIETGKNSLVINKSKKQTFKSFYNASYDCIKMGYSVIIVSYASMLFDADLMKRLKEKNHEIRLNPSYNEILELADTNKPKFILFTEDDKRQDYSATLEYACLAAESFLDNGEKVLLNIDEFERIYSCPDGEELYDNVLSDVLKSDVIVICASSTTEKSVLSAKMLPDFSYIIALNNKITRPTKNMITYVISAILGEKTMDMYHKILMFEEIENVYFEINDRLYDIKKMECRLFNQERRI